MPRCSFCKQNYEFPRGLTLILNDGNILYFCSSKCRRNQLHLKRDSKKTNWVVKADNFNASGTGVSEEKSAAAETRAKKEKKA